MIATAWASARSADAAPFIWMVLGALLAGLIGYASAQGPTSPNVIPGCVYNLTPPTLSPGQSAVLQCDANGKLRVTTS